jgi:hypothetical protein
MFWYDRNYTKWESILFYTFFLLQYLRYFTRKCFSALNNWNVCSVFNKFSFTHVIDPWWWWEFLFFSRYLRFLSRCCVATNRIEFICLFLVACDKYVYLNDVLSLLLCLCCKHSPNSVFNLSLLTCKTLSMSIFFSARFFLTQNSGSIYFNNLTFWARNVNAVCVTPLIVPISCRVVIFLFLNDLKYP